MSATEPVTLSDLSTLTEVLDKYERIAARLQKRADAYWDVARVAMEAASNG